jgi:very-short-patch-repair endonuclease
MDYYYKPWLKQWARDLRNNSTLGEVLLWQKLKGRQMMGYRFLRQRPIGSFIADFYCPKLRLVIEVDGKSHWLDHNRKRDIIKDRYLNSIGLEVIRIEDSAVKHKMTAVLEEITNWIEQHPP